jgi:cytochrome c2
MIKTLALALFSLLLISLACQPQKQAEKPSMSFNKDFKPLEFSLEEVIAADKNLRDTSVKISFDHFFKTRDKSYRAYPLEAILAPWLAQIKDTSNLQISFICFDGYAPSMRLSKVLKGEAYVAFRDENLPAGQDWPDSLAEKMRPYYLVWQGITPEDETYTWPYGLADIRIAAFFDEFAEAYPLHDAKAEKGFSLYQLHCMKCHSINKIGGIMGPELNYPKSITTYWQKEDIWQFVQNPQAYRYSAKMPPIAHLKREEFEEIYTYLESISKIKPKN